MTILFVLVIIILALSGYIIYLHIQLSKRNVFIETTVRRLSGIEKSRSPEEMMSFLREIQELSRYSSFFPGKLLDDSTLKFILENDRNMRCYIHYTKDEATARNILQNGFNFANSFYKTALPVTKDKLDLKMKHNSRKLFGEYIIVLCISNDVANYYSSELEKAGIRNHSFENILTETHPVRNENSDLVYQLSSQFIKGYVNHRTGVIVNNPVFDPLYNSPCFLKNIDLLKTDPENYWNSSKK